jgi:hypothetical protein
LLWQHGHNIKSLPGFNCDSKLVWQKWHQNLLIVAIDFYCYSRLWFMIIVIVQGNSNAVKLYLDKLLYIINK